VHVDKRVEINPLFKKALFSWEGGGKGKMCLNTQCWWWAGGSGMKLGSDNCAEAGAGGCLPASGDI